MPEPTERVEEIILSHDRRGMARLRRHLRPGYCARAAELLAHASGTVVIGTGFPVAGSFESDGPIGAIALYRVLERLGRRPVFACAPPLSRVLAPEFETYEIPIAGWDESRRAVARALDELSPSLLVSVERPGLAGDGRYYNMRGVDITDHTAKFDLFFTEGKVPTLAFGDGGNEIGMGNVAPALAELDITPSVTRCDVLVIASVSNWGVYGVLALLGRALGRDLLGLVDPMEIASHLFANGCVDGVTCRPDHTEDGFPLEVSLGIIRELREAVRAGSTEP
ncbi:DUF4392 domain-containing protein [Deferrisoma sp.]